MSRPRPQEQSPAGPWEGFETLDALFDALRCARFVVHQHFEVPGRGLVIEGTVTEGEVRPGMVLLPALHRHPSVRTPLPVHAVEWVRHPGGVERVGLVVAPGGTTVRASELRLGDGTVIDILAREPAV
jgi:hypothetical protein